MMLCTHKHIEQHISNEYFKIVRMSTINMGKKGLQVEVARMKSERVQLNTITLIHVQYSRVT